MTTRIVISVDYELFFGPKVGTVDNSMILPTEKLAECVEGAGFRLVLFVDAGFLVRARAESKRSKLASKQFDAVARQLDTLSRRGHDVQLHIHPHWENCRIEDGQWALDTAAYRLVDFQADRIGTIVQTYKEELDRLVAARVFAYRAGGWCMQPFELIAPHLKREALWLDSTVYSGGYSEVPGREYDFRGAPERADGWRFDSDPTIPTDEGYFLEIPISSTRYGSSAFWQLALSRFLTKPGDKPYGDGSVMSSSSSYYLRRLFSTSISPVSIDRTKASLLLRAFEFNQRRFGNSLIFNAMGHPKSLTPNGINHVREFLHTVRDRALPTTLADFAHLEHAGDRAGSAS